MGAADGLAPPPSAPSRPSGPSGPPSRDGVGGGGPARGGYAGPRGGGGGRGEGRGEGRGGPPRPAGGGRGGGQGGYQGRGGGGGGGGGGYQGRGGGGSFGGPGRGSYSPGGRGGYAPGGPPRGPDGGGGPSTSAPGYAGGGAGRGWGDRPPRAFSPPTSSGDFRPAPGGGNYGGGGGRGGGGGGGGRGGRRGNQGPVDDGLVKNGAIEAAEVRLLGTDKAMLGVMRLDDALALASEAGVDVVLISPDADPPVARLVSASKFRFEQAKAAKDASRKQREARQELKELKLRLNTDVHDYQVRLRAAQKFIAKGDKVKLTVSLRGREMEYAASCRELFDRFVSDLGGGDAVAVVAPPSMAGRQMSCILGPNKDKVAAAVAG